MSDIIRKIEEQLQVVGSSDGGHGVETWWRLFAFDEKTGLIRKMVSQKNIIPYQGADVLARLLGGDIDYKPAVMYFEFDNAGGVPVPPSPTRDEGIGYYLSDLALEAQRDYLRVPLVVTPAITSSGSDYAGNQVTFFAITAGSSGEHGKPFQTGSQVYGVGLAASPEPTQATSDLLFSRSYSGFSPVPKEDGYQIGAQYLIRFS